MTQETNRLPQNAVYYSTQSLPRYSRTEVATDKASELCQMLYSSIRQFDEQLDSTWETGIRLVAFGQSVTFSVMQLGYSDPSLIHFFGILDNGQPVQLIQHVSQISFLLTAIPRINPEKPKPPIGFTGPGTGTTV